MNPMIATHGLLALVRGDHNLPRIRLETRTRLLVAINDSPGQTLGALRELVKIGWGTLYYHIGKLEAEGDVRTVVAGRRILVFPGASSPIASTEKFGLLRGATARLIAQQILARPHCSIQMLVDSTRKTPRVVYYHVKRLKEAGLITSVTPNQHFGLMAAASLEPLLARIESSDRDDFGPDDSDRSP